MRVTLDRNCLIDIEENRLPYATDVRELVARGKRGDLALSVPASSASERPKPGQPKVTNFAEFREWVDQLDLGDVEFLAPILYLDFSFLDHSVLGGGPGQELEEQIHEAIAPNLPYQSVWCHIHYGTDVLCTRDERLIRRARALAPIGARLTRPADLVASL